MTAWDHSPVRRAASNEEAASCWEECDAGNGASCARLAKSFDAPFGTPTDPREPRQRCADALARKACALGLPFACSDSAKCAGPTREQAFSKLERACMPAVASWQCFYSAHAREMVWGAPPPAERDRLYREICSARCPPAPERCYKELACEVSRLR